VVEGAKWYRKAADQGHPDAQFNLGLCYAKGIGVLKDEVEGVKWLRKSAEQGKPIAQFLLGVAYELGKGVLKDEVESYAWINLSALTLEIAREFRAKHEKSLSRSEIEAGQKRSKELEALIEKNKAAAGTK
jgi:TPR repeat protein